MLLMEAAVHLFHDAADLIQHWETEVNIKPALVRNHGYVPLCVLEAYIRSVEPGLILARLEYLSHSTSQKALRRMFASRTSPLRSLICAHHGASA
jgi:hypothetical protein